MQSYCENMAQYRRNRQSSCQCSGREQILEGMPLAMAYVKWQTWRNIYDAEKGFSCGTIFEELNKPFRGMGGYQR